MRILVLHKFTSFLVLVVLSMMVLCFSLLKGLGTDIHWLAVTMQNPVTEPLVVPRSNILPPLQFYSDSWSKPLFNRDRLPDPVLTAAKLESTAPSLAGIVLTGLVISPPLRRAFFKTTEGKSLGVTEGQRLPNGWLLEHVESGRASLRNDSITQELIIPIIKVPSTSLH